MKIIAGLDLTSTILFYGNSGGRIGVQPPSPGTAPIPVEIDEEDEKLMEQVNAHLKSKNIRKFTDNDEANIVKAEKVVSKTTKALDKAKEAIDPAEKAHTTAVGDLNQAMAVYSNADESKKASLKKSVEKAEGKEKKTAEKLNKCHGAVNEAQIAFDTAQSELDKLST